MKKRASLLMTLLLLIGAHHTQCAEEVCDINLRTKIGAGQVLENGSFVSTKDGALYPFFSFWKDGETTWACPCLLGNCIRICSEGIVRALEKDWNIILDIGRTNNTIKIWEEEKEQEVVIDEEFKIIQDAWCQFGILLQPKDDEWDEFRIFPNGSIYFTHLEIKEEYRLVPPDKICIIPVDEQEIHTVLCKANIVQNLPKKRILESIIYIFLFVIVRPIFLLLPFIAFYHSPKLNNLHVRSMVCQSASLLMTGTTLTYIKGFARYVNYFTICITASFINLYFSIAYFFWLNVMCVDIFLTFKRTIAQKLDINFLYISLYAWGGPALLTVFVISLENGNSISGMGLFYCVFNGHWNEFLFYSVPLVILLSLNLILYCLTARQLWLQRRDSQRAFRGASSRVHAPPGQSQCPQNQRKFALYFKLFLLMGVTWITEVILWADRASEINWLFTDTANCLRNMLIFWFCFWSKENERKKFLGMFICCKKPAVQVDDLTSRDARVSYISTVSSRSTTA